MGILDDASAHPQLTQTGHTFGTPAYMAPEQTQKAQVRPSADLYALGVLLYEMHTGQRPFSGNVEQILAHKLTRPAPPLAPAGGLEHLVRSLLERKPEHRPESADAVCKILDALKTGPALVVDTDALSGPTLDVDTDALVLRNTSSNPQTKVFSKDKAPATLLLSTAEDIAEPQSHTRRTWGRVLFAGALMGLIALAGVYLVPAQAPLKPTHSDASRAPSTEPAKSARTDPPVTGPGPDAALREAAHTAPGAARSGLSNGSARTPPRIHDAGPETEKIEPGSENTESLKSNDRGVTPPPRRKSRRPRTPPPPRVAPPGKLRVKAPVWFDVFVDGHHFYRHPKVAQSLPPGRYEVRLENAELGCQSIRRTIRIVSDETTIIEAKCRQ